MSSSISSNEDNEQAFDIPPAHHPGGTAISAAAGGLVGGLVGSAVGGKQGRFWGAIMGAAAGGLAGNTTIRDDLIALEQQAAEALGEAPGEDELPAHYSWEQLQFLSRPQRSA